VWTVTNGGWRIMLGGCWECIRDGSDQGAQNMARILKSLRSCNPFSLLAKLSRVFSPMPDRLDGVPSLIQ
jgi:hypothetical protein